MINTEAITEAILSTGAGAIACENGASLVDAWIAEGVLADKKIVGVEMGFVLWLDELTAIIGVMDLLTEEKEEIIGNEFKTTKEAGKYWNESKWLTSITEGSQIAIYALALNGAIYYESGGATFRPGVREPRIRVRAISKSSPPVIWGGESELITFTDEQLEVTKSALLSKAAAIRGMRRAGNIPYQLPGHWCTNQWHRQCEYYSECTTGKYPIGHAQFSKDDPASQLALPYIGERINDPDLVILGASAYGAVSECAEKWRRGTLGGNKEESLALDTGTVLHAGCAEFYRQLRNIQNSSVSS